MLLWGEIPRRPEGFVCHVSINVCIGEENVMDTEVVIPLLKTFQILQMQILEAKFFIKKVMEKYANLDLIVITI